MSALKIPLQRFKAGLPVNGNVYVFLPRNQKQIRILNSGDIFEEAALLRYKNKGVLELLVEPNAPGAHLAENYAVHSEEAKTANSTVVAAENTQSATLLAATAAEDAPSASSSAESINQNVTSAAEIASTATTSEEKNSIKTAKTEDEPQSSFKPDNASVENQRISNTKKTEEPSFKITASADEKEAEQRFSGSNEIDIDEVVVKASANKKELEQSLKLKMLELETDIGDSSAEEALKKKQNMQRLQNAMANLEAGLPITDDSLLEELESNQTEVIGSFTKEELTIALKKKMQVAEIEVDGESSADSLHKKQNLQRIKNALANLEAGLPFTDETLLNEMESEREYIVKSGSLTEPEIEYLIKKKISDISKETESSPEADKLKKAQNLQRLKNALANLEAGIPISDDSLMAELEDFYETLGGSPEAEGSHATASPESENAEKLEDAAAKALLADRHAAPRDTRSAISSLATQLAYGIGYSDPNFLSDVAISALVYFAKLDGSEVKADSSLPSLTLAILDNKEAGNLAIADSKQILFFLERYLSNPDCDKLSKEISPNVLTKTEMSFATDGETLNPWNMARWQQFVKKGVGLSTMSLCSQASVRALKQIRTIL
jgi:hypothetical protein